MTVVEPAAVFVAHALVRAASRLISTPALHQDNPAYWLRRNDFFVERTPSLPRRASSRRLSRPTHHASLRTRRQPGSLVAAPLLCGAYHRFMWSALFTSVISRHALRSHRR